MAAGAALAAKRGKTFQKITAGRISRNVQVDEQSGTSASGEDQAQKVANPETEKKIIFVARYGRWKKL